MIPWSGRLSLVTGKTRAYLRFPQHEATGNTLLINQPLDRMLVNSIARLRPAFR